MHHHSPRLMSVSPGSLSFVLLLAASVSACQPLAAKSPDEASSPTATSDAAQLAAPTPASPTDAAEQAAQARAEAWLALIDHGLYAQSWDDAAAVFQASTGKDKWSTALERARGPLGYLSSRKLRAAEYKTDISGAPAGKYVVVWYDSAFAKKETAREIVTLRQAADDSWKVAGYFVQ